VEHPHAPSANIQHSADQRAVMLHKPLENHAQPATLMRAAAQEQPVVIILTIQQQRPAQLPALQEQQLIPDLDVDPA